MKTKSFLVSITLAWLAAVPSLALAGDHHQKIDVQFGRGAVASVCFAKWTRVHRPYLIGRNYDLRAAIDLTDLVEHREPGKLTCVFEVDGMDGDSTKTSDCIFTNLDPHDLPPDLTVSDPLRESFAISVTVKVASTLQRAGFGVNQRYTGAITIKDGDNTIVTSVDIDEFSVSVKGQM
jgi:hypothetical protein